MDRIYTNRRRGERRIHLEIEEGEITDFLDGIEPTDNSSEAVKRLVELLRQAHDAFHPDHPRGAAGDGR
ncbi:hypothetical protein [Kitasatospora sp. NPDC088779]|uniref:hypothetical protein n=1 Tax=Kitasatospora sp. NPDC088779 TaxID=3154964 RepID=UPI00342087D3